MDELMKHSVTNKTFTLYWNYDSPYSRCIKWLLLNKKIAHTDKILSWEKMRQTPSLALANPKKQVPTLVETDVDTAVEGEKKRRHDSAAFNTTDSLLIALDYVGVDWHRTLDAKLYRLADAEVEAGIIFLFRANLLKEKFGQSDNSDFMLKAGIDTYKSSIDLFIDHLLVEVNQGVNDEVNIGAVLLFSTLLAARSMLPETELSYRQAELSAFIDLIEADIDYQQMMRECAANLSEGLSEKMSNNLSETNQVSFLWLDA